MRSVEVYLVMQYKGSSEMQNRFLKVIGVDYAAIIFAVAGLLSLGMIMVLSASSVNSIQIHGNAYELFLKQVLFIGIGLALTFIGIRMSFEKWEILARFSFLLGFTFLILTLIFGKNINGNRNWIPVGPFLIQPSEFAKLALILFCAFQMKKFSRAEKSDPKGVIWLIALVSIIFIGLILAGRDLGTALIFAGIAFCLLFISGLNIFYTLGAFAVLGAGALALVISHPNRLNRVKAVFDPFAPEVYKFAGWQPAHSIMGLASGGIFGVGIGESKQKWANLAEAHTDFIFSVIGEEMGLIGTLIVLSLYVILILAIFRVATKCKDIFQKFAVAGIGFWLIFQIFTNLATNIGLAPVVGVTLPFISYGGSAIIANLLAVGFVLKIALDQGGVSIFSKLQRRIGL